MTVTGVPAMPTVRTRVEREERHMLAGRPASLARVFDVRSVLSTVAVATIVSAPSLIAV